MADSFPLLLSPIQVGPMQVKNRVVYTPHLTGYTRDYVPNERYIRYVEERAKGGAGWIVAEAATVHRSGSWEFMDKHFRGYDPAIVPLYRELSDRLHAQGAIVTQNLSHGGRNMLSLETFWPTWAPSPVRAAAGGDLPKEMEIEDLESLKEGYVLSARHAMQGGLDGIDLQITSDYLLNSFLVPALNRRTDQYGGSRENRMRYIVEILEAVRAETGPDFGIGVRCAGALPAFTGFTDEEFLAVYTRLDELGLVDWISVHAGSYFNNAATVPPMEMEKANAAPLGELLKQHVKVPVVMTGRIDTPALAEELLATGKADLVGVMRAQMADPMWVVKASIGQADRIRPCVYCNQNCLSGIVSCIQNPAVGQEATLGEGTLQPAATPRRVVVVGGGVAGMEAARVAAERGHQVELYEASFQLGGQVNLATVPKHRAEFGGTSAWLIAELLRLEVPVFLNRRLSADEILAMNADAVILATGAHPDRRGSYASRPDLEGIPGAEQEHVITAWDALTGWHKLRDKRVVFVDESGHHEGMSTMVFLTEKGISLEIVTTGTAPGLPALYTSREWGLLWPPVLKAARAVHGGAMVTEITPDAVRIRQSLTGTETEIPADVVVLAMGSIPDDALYRELKGKHPDLRRIGDCVTPRRIGMAIYEGTVAGRDI